jgi:RNA polymerase subunit RPABC4/transcription elongation factor Spt4
MDLLLEKLPGIAMVIVLATSAILSGLWMGMILWTYKDMRNRSRDVIAQILASLMVAILTLPGLFIYFLLRPKETLSEAYERALEQEALLQAIEEPEVCPSCGAKTRAEFLYCPYCHAHLKKTCHNCRHPLQLDWTLCPYCGTPQVAAAVPEMVPAE